VITAYFDSSAILKLSKDEDESLALVDYLDDGPIQASTSVLSEIEVLRSLRRHRLDDEHAVTGFYLLALDDEVRRRAVEVGGGTLRSLDAIHLATALSIADREVQFVTYDDRQAEAARQAGLKVVQPGRAPSTGSAPAMR
jgi:predicted nucleic acid-binding protein